MAGALLASILFNGCAAKQSQSLLDRTPDGLAVVAKVEHVPFFAQSENQCGPAALAMALNWARVSVTPAQLVPKLFIPDRKGSLQVEMMAAPRRYGVLAYQLNPQLADLLREIADGHPVVVFQNLGLSWHPQWHYAVAIGYDLRTRTITLHSGMEDEHTIPLSMFEHTWARAGYWAMLTLPAGILPATADETRLMQAAVNLEKAEQLQAAVTVYEAALVRWPGSLVARMGRGNSYYALGNLDKAGQAFYRATLDHPRAASAFNNLAQVYLEQNRLDEARDAIEQAIRLDSESQIYRKTQTAILKQSSRKR